MKIKKISFLAAILLVFAMNAQAQWIISESWDLTGNSLSSNSSFLGTTNSYPLVFKTNNTARMTLSASYPYLGIGTTPASNLHVHSINNINYFLMTNLYVGANSSHGFLIKQDHQKVYIKQQEYDYMYIQTPGGGLAISGGGNVGIGTNTPQAKLAVNGEILAKSVRVNSDASYWPDYVFEKDYNLMTIRDLETYVQIHKHLPGIPSAQEVEQKQDVDLGEMNTLLLQKMEEMTLYIIQLEKRLSELEN